MIIKGISVSKGFCIGKIFVKHKNNDINSLKMNISNDEIQSEINKFKRIIEVTKLEFQNLYKEFYNDFDKHYADIFSAYIMILEDPIFIADIIKQIEKCISLEFALNNFIKNIDISFDKIEDNYFKERKQDIIDVIRKIITNVNKKSDEIFIPNGAIIVAESLSPVEAISIKNKSVKAFLTSVGGKTSHIAILAQILQIPAIIGLKNITNIFKSGDMAIVNGYTGEIIINPNKNELKDFENDKIYIQKNITKLLREKDLPAITKSGERITIFANIGLNTEIDSVIENGAEGIGLYRTEFLYLNKNILPSEEEQFKEYSYIAKKMYPKPVIIRTIDVGGDKFLDNFNRDEDKNPFLGMRGIRFTLKYQEIFKTQLRAILRASIYDNIEIMYPMISVEEEILEANKILDEIKLELKKNNIKFNDKIKVGSMIETPSSAIIVDRIAEISDFLSIGTNDLMQYIYAIDRMNESVSHLYNTKHLSILRFLYFILQNSNKKRVEICGEMANDESLLEILICLGLRVISIPPINIPRIKEIIRNIDIKKSKNKIKNMLFLKNIKI